MRRFPARKLSLGSERFDYECISLQLRKILELIAFGSLCANRDAYAAVHSHFDEHWKAVKLLESLRAVHVDFFPKPMKFGKPPRPDVRHLDYAEDGFLTEAEFATLYDKCSQVIHTWNPFSKRERKIEFGRSVSQWTDRIEALVQLHSMRLVDTEEIWLVRLHDPSDGKVHALTLTPRPAA